MQGQLLLERQGPESGGLCVLPKSHQVMNVPLKMMNFKLNLMKFVLKMTIFPLKMTDFGAAFRGGDGPHPRGTWRFVL